MYPDLKSYSEQARKLKATPLSPLVNLTHLLLVRMCVLTNINLKLQDNKKFSFSSVC